jgi:hypothetical protein
MRPSLHFTRNFTDESRPVIYRFFGVLFVVAIFLVCTTSLRAQDDVSDLIQQARSEFKPVTEGQPAKVRAEVRERMDDVANYVGR